MSTLSSRFKVEEAQVCQSLQRVTHAETGGRSVPMQFIHQSRYLRLLCFKRPHRVQIASHSIFSCDRCWLQILSEIFSIEHRSLLRDECSIVSRPLRNFLCHIYCFRDHFKLDTKHLKQHHKRRDHDFEFRFCSAANYENKARSNPRGNEVYTRTRPLVSR